MNIKFLKMAFAGLVLGVSSFANAGLIVDVEWVVGSTSGYNGSFSGTDIDNDGFITISEVTYADSFLGSTLERSTASSFLYGFGDFDIANVLWINNGATWTHSPTNLKGYVSFDGNYSVANWADSQISYRIVNLQNSQLVPEPSTLAILALGLMGLASRRFKKQS